jgi:O-antigen/teichoic acid export membrane protein
MIGLALVTFTTPLAAVMFPKIVRSIARSEKSDALSLAFATTAGLAGIVALTCTVVPELPLRVMYFRKPEFWVAAPLVPWFAWSVLPITVANVLIVNLMAWGRFRVVPWLVTVAVAYGICLGSYVVNTPAGPFDAPEESFRAFRGVVQILGVFSTLLLGVAAWFTWGAPRKSLG